MTKKVTRETNLVTAVKRLVRTDGTTGIMYAEKRHGSQFSQVGAADMMLIVNGSSWHGLGAGPLPIHVEIELKAERNVFPLPLREIVDPPQFVYLTRLATMCPTAVICAATADDASRFALDLASAVRGSIETPSSGARYEAIVTFHRLGAEYARATLEHNVIVFRSTAPPLQSKWDDEFRVWRDPSDGYPYVEMAPRCKLHPQYKGVQPPTKSKCKRCSQLYDLALEAGRLNS